MCAGVSVVFLSASNMIFETVKLVYLTFVSRKTVLKLQFSIVDNEFESFFYLHL